MKEIMKNCYCPHCGTKQKCKLDEPSKMVILCHACKRSLLVKAANDELFVRVKPIVKSNAKAV